MFLELHQGKTLGTLAVFSSNTRYPDFSLLMTTVSSVRMILNFCKFFCFTLGNDDNLFGN